MRIPALVFLLITTAAHAVPPSPAAAYQASARDIALDNLLSERESAAALDTVIKAARENGISEQAILEARFLYHVDRREDDAIAAMLPEFRKQEELFKIQDSVIFGVKEDWLAVVEYVQAIDSLKRGDKDAFKTHITEAFWLSPRQAAAFAPHIERLRLAENMRTVKVDFQTRLLPVAPGDAVALETLMIGKKALLFHFWSPFSRESEASLPDFAETSALLSVNDIAVVSLVPDDSPKLLAGAREMILPLAGRPSCKWLIDPAEDPLGRRLRIQNLPTMVLVSPDGKVLFNGDPGDDDFWKALKNVDPRIDRPDSDWEHEGQ